MLAMLSYGNDMFVRQKSFSYVWYNSPSAIVLHDLRFLLKQNP